MSLSAYLLLVAALCCAPLQSARAQASSTPNTTPAQESASDAPRALFEQGYFEQALEAVTSLLEEGATLEGTIAVLEVRALVHLALGDTDSLRATLAHLLAFAPAYAPPPTASPDYAAEVGRARQVSAGELSAAVQVDRNANTIMVSLRTSNLPPGFGLRSIVRARRAGTSALEWQEHDSGWVVTPRSDLVIQAVVFGRNGSLFFEGEVEPLAMDPIGSRPSPETSNETLEGASSLPGAQPTHSGRRRRRVIWGVLAALVAAGGIAVGIAVSQRGSVRYAPVIDW